MGQVERRSASRQGMQCVAMGTRHPGVIMEEFCTCFSYQRAFVGPGPLLLLCGRSVTRGQWMQCKHKTPGPLPARQNTVCIAMFCLYTYVLSTSYLLLVTKASLKAVQPQ